MKRNIVEHLTPQAGYLIKDIFGLSISLDMITPKASEHESSQQDLPVIQGLSTIAKQDI